MRKVLFFFSVWLILMLFIIPAVAAGSVPGALTGNWTGTTGDIELDFSINPDGTGHYTFKQNGYLEEYDIVFATTDESFEVIIPEENALGITACDGQYEFRDGQLFLTVNTTLSSGRVFSYEIGCERVEPDNFIVVWHEKPLRIVLITDDAEVINYTPPAGNDPRQEGERFIKIQFAAIDEPLTGDEIQQESQEFILRDAAGNEYPVIAFTNVAISFEDGTFGIAQEQPVMALLFSVPERLEISELSLIVPDLIEPFPLFDLNEVVD